VNDDNGNGGTGGKVSNWKWWKGDRWWQKWWEYESWRARNCDRSWEKTVEINVSLGGPGKW
jgi:hypothetical protein